MKSPCPCLDVSQDAFSECFSPFFLCVCVSLAFKWIASFLYEQIWQIWPHYDWRSQNLHFPFCIISFWCYPCWLIVPANVSHFQNKSLYEPLQGD